LSEIEVLEMKGEYKGGSYLYPREKRETKSGRWVREPAV
jgi:hypothetical protein